MATSPEAQPSEQPPATEVPVKLEDEARAEHSDSPEPVTDDQWKSMMDVVMAIYAYREEECVFLFLFLFLFFGLGSLSQRSPAS
jgi:hypothetical protein